MTNSVTGAVSSLHNFSKAQPLGNEQMLCIETRRRANLLPLSSIVALMELLQPAAGKDTFSPWAAAGIGAGATLLACAIALASVLLVRM